MENKNEMNEERILAEDVSLEQPKRNQESKKDKGTKKPIIVLLVAVLVIAVALIVKPVRRELFTNDMAEEIKSNDNSLYKNKGLSGLRGWDEISPAERDIYRKRYPDFRGYSMKQAKIVYANNLYIDRFGEESFHRYDYDVRDKQYKESVVRQAIYEQFGEDEGLIAWLNGLTLQEKIDFLESNYQASMNNFEYEWQKNDFESRVYDTEGFDWYTIGDYIIPIPKTMYLSGDTSFNLKYKFFQNDPSKNSSIIVNCHDGDYSEMATFLKDLNHHYIKEDDEIAHLREIVQFRVSFKDEAKQMSVYSHAQGRDMSNCKGPDFIDIGGQIVIHAEYDQVFKDPVTHVDTYSFYSPTKYMVVMTGCPVTEEKDSKAELEKVVRGIRKIK